jgi:hypothetical protein
MTLFEKIAASLHQRLDTVPGQLAVLSHGVPCEDGHYLLDVDHQRGVDVVGDSHPPHQCFRSPEVYSWQPGSMDMRNGHEHAPCGMSMQHEHAA